MDDLPAFILDMERQDKQIRRDIKEGVLVISLLSAVLFGPAVPEKIRQKQEVYLPPDQIETVFQQEKKALGITKNIELLIYENDELLQQNTGGYVAKHPLEGYVIGLNKNYTGRLTIRHELYHIYAGHADKAGVSTLNTKRDPKLVPYSFTHPNTILGDLQKAHWNVWEHPSCDIYALTDLRL